MISTDNIVRGFALCCAFVSAGLLLCLLLPLKLCYGIINTESPVFLDFSRVRGFFVTNLLLVQCSNAVLLYFYGYILFHLFLSIYAP